MLFDSQWGYYNSLILQALELIPGRTVMIDQVASNFSFWVDGIQVIGGTRRVEKDCITIIPGTSKHVHWGSSFRQNSLSGSFQLKVWDKNWKIEHLGLGSLHKFGILGEKINDRQNSIAHNPNIKMVPWPKYSRDIICQWDFIRNSKHIFSKHAVVFHDTVYSLLLLEVTQKSITALKNRPMK